MIVVNSSTYPARKWKLLQSSFVNEEEYLCQIWPRVVISSSSWRQRILRARNPSKFMLF